MIGKVVASLVIALAVVSLSSCHDHMHRQFLDVAAFPSDSISSSHINRDVGSSGSSGIPWKHKTSFQVSNGQQWTGDVRSDAFKATVNHDVVGGKNWNAGGYVTHERTNGFRDGFTHGGVRANINF